MGSATVLVELCAGTAAVSRYALGHHGAHGRASDLCGYMGSKRRWAGGLVASLLGGVVPDHALLVDAGPWGDWWSTILRSGAPADVADLLDQWADETPSLVDLWPTLVQYGPPDGGTYGDAVHRAAQYIALQARTPSCVPIWWDTERGLWVGPTGSRTEVAHQRGGRTMQLNQKMAGTACKASMRSAPDAAARKVGPATTRMTASNGLHRVRELARRVRELARRVPLDRMSVIHADVREVAPIGGAYVFFDPPYQGCARYAAVLPRADVLDVAQRWARAARAVLVTEAAPLDLERWNTWRLARREYVTALGCTRCDVGGQVVLGAA